MKIIFLDFDGVLTIPATGFNYGHTTAIRELNRITTTTNAVVVVSSTWRMAGLDSVKHDLNSWGFSGMVLDITPGNDFGTRGADCNQWLQWHKDDLNVTHFVAIDDNNDLDDIPLVQTNTMIGLTRQDADKAIKILMEEK